MTIATPLPEKKSAPLKVEPPLFENSVGGSTPPPAERGGGGGGGAHYGFFLFCPTAYPHNF